MVGSSGLSSTARSSCLTAPSMFTGRSAAFSFDRIGMARKNDTEVVASCGETSSLNTRLIQELRFRNQLINSHQNGTLRERQTVFTMLSNKYEKNSARCVRLARESGDTVLSYGLMKMAEAWLELDRNRHRKTLREHRRQTRSRRAKPRIGSPSRRGIRRSKAPSKTVANKQTG